ncbi:MAG: hypothetical protein ACRDPW_08305 [Mycobacteriales bacterium]
MSDRDVPNGLYIAQRFRGPHYSGNGGYTAGALAQRLLVRTGGGSALSRAVSVTLRQPPPLDASMKISATDNKIWAAADGIIVAQAQLAGPLAAAPAPVSAGVAAEATGAYRGHAEHPFPFCFSCGTQRETGDALRLFAGPVPGRPGVTATPWQPGASFSQAVLEGSTGCNAAAIATPVVWAALDCPGAWAANVDSGRPIVLGRIAAVVHHELPAEESYVVVGECRRQEGHKAFTATAIYDPDGRLMAAAVATWLAIDPATFAGLR